MNKNKTRAHPISDDKDQSIVPDGYKRTDTGIIPENWDEVRVGDIAKVKGGKRLPSGFVLVDTPTPHPYVRVKDMYPGGVNQSEIKYVPEQAFPAIQNYRIYSGDVFISVAGSLGIVGVVPPQLGGANLTENADYITDLKCDRDYLKYYLMSEPIQKVIQLIRTTGAQPKLALGRIAEFVISIPQDINEQCAIAEVLSDVDGLLNALEALIAKKRAIKQAIMQQLLTGKTLLPGFSGAWETKRLMEIADCLDNVRVPLNETQRATMTGPYPYCGANGVLDYVKDYVLDDDVILIAEDGGHFDEFLSRPIAYRMRGKIWVNNHAHILKAKSDYDQGFLYFSLVHKNILPYLSGGTRAKLNKFEMYKIEVNVPDDTDEQRAVASVLSDMDAEIAALEQRRDKTRAIKQGMMQLLLTGQVRLLK